MFSSFPSLGKHDYPMDVPATLPTLLPCLTSPMLTFNPLTFPIKNVQLRQTLTTHCLFTSDQKVLRAITVP